MKKTKIEWCDSTWNPVTGCWHGCEYCYARKIASRFGGATSFEVDASGNYVESNLMPTDEIIHVLDEPIYRDIDGKKTRTAYPYYFEPTFYRYKLKELSRWTKPRNIFVCSMSDLFGDWVPDSWIEEIFAACDKAPQHRYLFLTKNPKRYGELAKAGKLPKRKSNWWFGCSVTDMKSRIFGGSIYWNTFISVEPVLEYMDVGLGSFGSASWVIIGAETGNRKNKVVPEKSWIDRICYAAGITHAAVFMKDSLLPIMGEENMRREFPWEGGIQDGTDRK